MKRILCENLPRRGRPAELSENEAHHALRVLRLRDGETVEALDGSGRSVVAILRFAPGPPRLEVNPDAKAPEPRQQRIAPLTLEIAVLKGEAMEWVIEKAVELGVGAIAPVTTDYTVVQVDRKGPEAFRARWQKIADQALKQCGRLTKMPVAAPLPLERLLADTSGMAAIARAWCDEAAAQVSKDSNGDSAENAPDLAKWLTSPRAREAREVRLLIGPEGGWSPEERRMLLQSAGPSTERVSLGDLVLRAETAAIYATSLAVSALRQR